MQALVLCMLVCTALCTLAGSAHIKVPYESSGSHNSDDTEEGSGPSEPITVGVDSEYGTVSTTPAAESGDDISTDDESDETHDDDDDDDNELVVKIVYAPSTSSSSSSLLPTTFPAASALSLTCIVLGKSGQEITPGVSYEWESTCPSGRCFVGAGATTRNVSTHCLSGLDSGVYTCRARDLAGCKGSASITVNVVGVGIYGEDEDGIIPNNGLVTSGSFRCISAATNPSVSELIGPSGAVISRRSSSGGRTNLTFSEEGSSMRVGGVQDLSEEEVGVYTCRVSDETGDVVEINVGLYPTQSQAVVTSIQTQVPGRNEYSLSCISHFSTPTEVIWERNGQRINKTSTSPTYYQFQQTLKYRFSSTYNNTLVIQDNAEDLIGEYSCTVVNALGRSNTFTKSVTAVEVRGHKRPVLTGLARNITCSTQLEVTAMEWVLVGVGNPEPVTERSDGGQTLVLSLLPRTEGLDGAMFVCRISTQSGRTFTKTVTVQVKDLENSVVINGSSSPSLVAGVRHSLSCHVRCDLPSRVVWLDHQGNAVVSSAADGGILVEGPVTDRVDTTLTLTFDPLLTQHGGLYTCVSTLDFPYSQENATKAVIVQIPPPTVSLSLTPDTNLVYTTSPLSVRCAITVHPSAHETPTSIAVSLTDNGGSLGGTRNLSPTSYNYGYAVRSETNGTHHDVMADFFSISSAYAAASEIRYACSASVRPDNGSSPYVVPSMTVRSEEQVSIGLNVSIRIAYTSPDSYPEYAPPNYRPASAVTLTCLVGGATGRVTYSWSSTCSNCFASSGYGSSVSDNFLTVQDAGVHTCTVRDAGTGKTGNASIPMNIVGVGLRSTYCTGGFGGSNVNNPNNTYAYVSTRRYSNTRFSFLCCTNTTTPSFGNLRLPTGTVYSSTSVGSYTSHPNNIRLTRYHTGSYQGCLQVSVYTSYSRSYYYHTPLGVYTCEIPDSTGATRKMMFGLSTGYTSLVKQALHRVPSAEGLAISFRSSGRPPANIQWFKDNLDVKLHEGLNFTVTQTIVDYPLAVYNNLLVIRDIESMAGAYKNAYTTPPITIQGIRVESSINPSNLRIGNSLTLNCSSDLDVLRVEWYRGDDRVSSISGRNHSSLRHALVRASDDGVVYRCVVIGSYGKQERSVTLTVIIPDNWSSVSVVPSIRENPHNNTQYSLTCTVRALRGLNLPVMVEWVGPDSGTVLSSRTLEYTELEQQGLQDALSLTFDPITHGDGGTYTCRAYVSVNWTKEQPPQHSDSLHVLVITETLFQLRLFPLPLCINWDHEKAQELEYSIKTNIEKAMREQCSCNFTTDAIYSGEFSCQFGPDGGSSTAGRMRVTYRAILSGNSDLLPANQLLAHLQEWRSVSGTLLLHDIFRLRVDADSECSVSIGSFEDRVCEN